MNRLGVVVVLYDPTTSQLTHLRKISLLGVDIVAVDNSPNPDAAKHEELSHAGVPIVINRNRGGLGGGLNRGVDALIEAGHDLIMLLDQDSEFDDDFFERMIRGAAAMRPDDFVLGARVWETTSHQYLQVRPPPAGVVVPSPPPGLWSADDLITSGTTFSASTYRRLGAFREDLFIEAIDSEYSLRARRANVGLYVVHDAVIRQIRGDSVVRFGLATTRLNAARRYYLARNAIAVRREYGLGAGAAVKMVTIEAAKVAIFETGKTAKIAGFACGLADGARRRMGPFDERHPRLARYASSREH